MESIFINKNVISKNSNTVEISFSTIESLKEDDVSSINDLSKNNLVNKEENQKVERNDTIGQENISESNDISTSTKDVDFSKQYKTNRKNVIREYESNILNLIKNDFFEDGIISSSEEYILDNFNENGEYIRAALNSLYLTYYSQEDIIIGILIMIGSISYDDIYPEGQTMALGLLQHKNDYVRERAIQVFERWNNKKGLPILESLKMDKKWLQDYVEDVIFYMKKYGSE